MGRPAAGELNAPVNSDSKGVLTFDVTGRRECILKMRFTNNNTHAVLCDRTGAQVIAKQTGGMNTKNGRDKNSVKIAELVLESILDTAQKKGIKYLILEFSSKGNKKHLNYKRMPNYKAVNNLFSAKNPDELVQSFVVIRRANKTPIGHGYLRPQGGRRGRRV